YVELGGVEGGELSVRGHERFLGGRVLRDGREQAGGARQRAAYRRRDDGGRDRAPARGTRELGGAEQFREPVDGEERHADDTATDGRDRAELTRREPAASRDPD